MMTCKVDGPGQIVVVEQLPVAIRIQAVPVRLVEPGKRKGIAMERDPFYMRELNAAYGAGVLAGAVTLGSEFTSMSTRP